MASEVPLFSAANLLNDSSSVYFLHPSKCPGQLLVTIPLSD